MPFGFYISCLSPESLNVVNNLAGLLAWGLLQCLPVTKNSGEV